MNYSINNIGFQPMKIELPLIHVTQEYGVLKQIIQTGFKPSYCTEYLSNNLRQIKAAFPMVSFSNMELSATSNYLRSYGMYAIAMKKDWAAKNKLNPVLYLERNSSFTDYLINLFDKVKNLTDREVQASIFGRLVGEKHLLVKTLIELFSYSKNYDGLLVRNNGYKNEQYPFGLEREWRYVFRDELHLAYLIGEEVNTKQIFNKKIEHIRLEFELEDIHSIIVETEWQQNHIYELLELKYAKSDYKPEVNINTIRHAPSYM